LQTTLATLLFVTSAVILACVVVEFAVTTFEQTLDAEDSPQIERIREIENSILNQTDALLNEMATINQTETQTPDLLEP